MADWTTYQCTLAEDAVNTRVGSLAVKCTVDPASYSQGYMTKTINQSFDADKPLRLYFYVTNQVTAAEYVRVQIATDAGFTNSLLYDISQLSKGLHTGWNSVDIYPTEWTQTGDAVMTDTFVRLRLLLHPEAGTIQIVSFDSIEKALVNKPSVLLSFDDGFVTDYELAFPFLQCRNIKATCYVIEDSIGTEGYMTEAQILELAAAGWRIGVHDNVNWLSVGVAQMETNITDLQSYLTGIGLTQNINDVAYPQGDFDQDILDSLSGLGIETARTIKKLGTCIPGGDNDLVVAGWSIHNTDTVQDVKNFINSAITYNRPISLIFHKLTTSPTTYQYDPSDFKTIIDYIIAQELAIYTIEDYKNLASGGVDVPHT